MLLFIQFYLIGALLVKHSSESPPTRSAVAELSKEDAFSYAKSQSLDISTECQLPNDGNILIV